MQSKGKCPQESSESAKASTFYNNKSSTTGLDFVDFPKTNVPKAQTPTIHKTFCIHFIF